MGMKSTTIDIQHLRTKQAIEVILTNQIYKEVWEWNIIDHSRAMGCRIALAKIME